MNFPERKLPRKSICLLSRWPGVRMTMPHRLVSEIPAGPPGVVLGACGGIGMKRLEAPDIVTAG